MKTFLSLWVLSFLWLGSAESVHALPPPDFIFQAGSQLVQVLSAAAVFLGMGMAFFRHQLKAHAQKVAVVTAALAIGVGVWMSLPTSSVQSLPAGILLDVREDEERAVGYLPGSIHIRKADLEAGSWKELPPDQPITTLCYSSARAKQAAEFLSAQGLNANALEGGLNQWEQQGGDWQGSLKFNHDQRVEQVYQELDYQTVQEHLANGALLIDSREQRHYDWWHVDGAVSVPAYFTSSTEMDQILDRVPAQSDVVLFCDGIARGCFSSLISGLKLSERGHQVLGKISDIRPFKNL